MKELSIEEKAKAYDDIIERLKDFQFEYRFSPFSDVIGDKFPELKESEDERMRRWIINYLDNKALNSGIIQEKTNIKNAIAWLEKQGEQKPADKVEPKFKAGDWIIDIQGVSENQIIGHEDDSYHIKTSCSQFYLPMKLTEKNYRLWTIQDAKDGDVLAYPDGSITLFKYMVENIYMAHVLWVDGHIELNNSCAVSNVHPATKEQRDTLFTKMKEAGYEWDAEKKELRKIEQKPAWSEDDEDNIFNIVGALDVLIQREIEKEHNGDRNASPKYYSDLQDWLKSLKDRYTWKPSDEQMTQLKRYCPDNRPLTSLYEQLKKLMEE